MSEKNYNEVRASTLALLIVSAISITVSAFALFNYADMKGQRDALLRREAMRQHDERLLKGQRDYTVHEMLGHMKSSTQEVYPGASQGGEVKLIESPPTIIEDSDTPEAIREIDERHTREDAAGQPRSYAPGLPPG